MMSMSKQEFSRLEVLQRVQSGRLRVADACDLRGPKRRQVFRLLHVLKQGATTAYVPRRNLQMVRYRPEGWPRPRSGDTRHDPPPG